MRQSVAKALRRQAYDLTRGSPQFFNRMYKAIKRAYYETPWKQRENFTIKRNTL